MPPSSVSRWVRCGALWGNGDPDRWFGAGAMFGLGWARAGPDKMKVLISWIFMSVGAFILSTLL